MVAAMTTIRDVFGTALSLHHTQRARLRQRLRDPRGEQPERLAANEAGCGRISLRCASMRRKIALNSPGIRGMSDEAATLSKSRRRRPSTSGEADGLRE